MSDDRLSTEPLDLLQEWYSWWLNTDEVPVKIPNALHIRTALALVDAGRTDVLAWGES